MYKFKRINLENVKVVSKKWQATTQQYFTPRSSYANQAVAIRQLKIA